MPLLTDPGPKATTSLESRGSPLVSTDRQRSTLSALDLSRCSGSGDFGTRLGSATFLPGMLTRHIVVTVYGNATSVARQFVASLTGATGARITDAQGTATLY